MGRGRGKGKKLTVTSHEDAGSGEEEKISTQKRRGRPQKPLKDDLDEEDVEKIEEGESDSNKNGLANNEMKNATATEQGKKRKRSLLVKDNLKSDEEEKSNGNRPGADNLTKVNGLRQNGSRRKSTPRRAAEAGVQCK